MSRPPEEIAPKLWRIPVPLPSVPGAEHLGFVNAYAIGGERWALVDTGMTTDDGLQALDAGLSAAGLTWPDIELVLITHHHPDHYGTSARIKEMSGADVMIHRRDIEFIFSAIWGGYSASEFVVSHGGPEIDIPTAMFIQMPGFQPAAPDGYLRDDQIIDLGNRDLRVLHTPGHAPGHCCFALEEESIVLTGDHILPKITPHVGYFPGGDPDPLGDFLDGLKRVGEGSYRSALPAHGEPFLDPATRVARIVGHHEFRIRATIDALGREPKTGWEVIPAVFGEVEGMHLFAALFETLSHLVHAEVLGQVKRIEDGDVVRWARA